MPSAYKSHRAQARASRRASHAARFRVHPGTLYVVADGSCRQTDTIGGWGSMLVFNGHRKYACGGGPGNTNNTMELTGILRGLQMVRVRDKHPVVVVTDSKYALSAIFHYSAMWARNGWMTAGGTPVKNRELIEAIIAERATFASCRGEWVPGHEGVEFNEIVDRLAGHARNLFCDQEGELAHDAITANLNWSGGLVK